MTLFVPVTNEGAIRDIRLLKAGHPPHPSAPPAPLHWPPPGHEPGMCSGSRYGTVCGLDDNGVAAVVGAAGTSAVVGCGLFCLGVAVDRLKFVGRGALRVFWYRPHALQITFP